MKTIFTHLAIGLTFISQLTFAQADNWSSVISNGFGSPQNYDVIEFNIFNDTLYAGCGRTGFGAAQLWRSGDGFNWSQVIYDSTTNSVKGIPAISSDSGYIWIATGNPAQGTQVYRSQNGINWTPISKKGFGTPALWSPTPNMVLFQGTGDTIPYLYAAGNSHGGPAKSQIWRTPYTNADSTQWSLVVNFNVADTTCTQVTYFYVWNNKLYFGSNGDSLLYSSTDGLNFVADAVVQAAMPGSTRLIACLIDLNGNLYASTNNVILGGQLWRTDGNTWTNISSLIPGLGIADEELHNLDTTNGYLWITAYTDTAISSGSPIWRSTDNTGSAFVQSNTNGFGDPLIDGENPATIGYQGRQYFGGPNYSYGGQIWRTTVLTGISSIESETDSISIYPNPFSSSAILYSDKNLVNATLSVINCQGQTVMKITNINGHEIVLNRDDLLSGLYFVRVTEEDKVIATEKIIVD